MLFTAIEGDVFAVLEHIEHHIVALVIPPSAQGGVGGGIDLALRQGGLDGCDGIVGSGVHRYVH